MSANIQLSEENLATLSQMIVTQMNEMQYAGYADVEKFKVMTGISDYDFKEKVLHHPTFAEALRRFDGSRKYYIHIENGKQALEQIFKEAN